MQRGDRRNILGTIRVNRVKNTLKSIKEKGAFYIFVGNFANKFVTLCGSIFVVRLLTKEEYGTLSYLENLYSYVYIFAGLGLAAALLRYIVIADSLEKRKGYYYYVLKQQTLYNLLIIVIVAVFNVFYNHPEEYLNASWLFALFLLDIPFSDVVNSNLSTERSMFANKRYAFLALITVVISVLFRVLGSFLGGIVGNIIFRIGADILCAGILSGIVIKSYFKGRVKEALTKAERKEINRYSFQNMMANGFWILYLATDMFLLGRLTEDATVLADYKVAILIANNVIIISNAIAVFAGPYFIRNEMDHTWVMRNYKKVIIVNAILLGGLVLLLIIFARPLIWLLYGEAYMNVVPLMRLFLIAAFLNGSFRAMNSSLLAIMGQAKINMVISCIGFCVQVVGCLIVIPRFGVIGLAVENIGMYILLSLVFTGAFIYKYGRKVRKLS